MLAASKSMRSVTSKSQDEFATYVVTKVKELLLKDLSKIPLDLPKTVTDVIETEITTTKIKAASFLLDGVNVQLTFTELLAKYNAGDARDAYKFVDNMAYKMIREYEDQIGSAKTTLSGQMLLHLARDHFNSHGKDLITAAAGTSTPTPTMSVMTGGHSEKGNTMIRIVEHFSRSNEFALSQEIVSGVALLPFANTYLPRQCIGIPKKSTNAFSVKIGKAAFTYLIARLGRMSIILDSVPLMAALNLTAPWALRFNDDDTTFSGGAPLENKLLLLSVSVPEISGLMRSKFETSRVESYTLMSPMATASGLNKTAYGSKGLLKNIFTGLNDASHINTENPLISETWADFGIV